MRLTERVDARPIGVVRAGVGIAALLVGLEVSGFLARLAAPGVVRLPVVEAIAAIVIPLWWALIAAWMAAALALAVGWQARIAGACLVLLVTMLFLTDQQLYSNHLYLLALVAGILAAAGADRAFSLQARLRRDVGGATVPAWGPFLIKAQMSVVYAFSALAKLNAVYLSGSVMASFLRTDGPFAFPDAWRTFEIMFGLSVVAVALEALLAIGLWIPKWRRNAFVAGLGLHLAILLTFQPMLPFAAFGLLSLSLYVVFLDVRPAARLVIWDRSCEFCGGWVRASRRLDWLGALSYAGNDEEQVLRQHAITTQAANEAIHLVDTEGVWRGFDAVRRIAEVLPISFLWAPLLGLPPVRWLGSRVYDAVARRRKCSWPGPPRAEGDLALLA